MKTKVAVLPIWKVIVADTIYYFLIGASKKTAIEALKTEDLMYEGKPVVIEPVLPEESHRILLQLDSEDEDEYTTLFEEAKYCCEHNFHHNHFLASSFDVVANFNL